MLSAWIKFLAAADGAHAHRRSLVALNTKLGLFNAADGFEALPAYYSDNYISLLPGQDRSIAIDLSADVEDHPLRLSLRGWDLVKSSIVVAEETAEK
jgi:hypothetical protein